MIELTMEEFILWMIGAPLLGIGLYCFFAGLKRRSTVRKNQMQILSCRICGNLYKDMSRERSPKCPECGRRNDKGDSRRLG